MKQNKKLKDIKIDTPLLSLNEDFIKGIIREELLNITDTRIDTLINDRISNINLAHRIENAMIPIIEKRANDFAPESSVLKDLINDTIKDRIKEDVIKEIASSKIIDNIIKEKIKQSKRTIDFIVEKQFNDINTLITKKVQNIIRGRWGVPKELEK